MSTPKSSRRSTPFLHWLQRHPALLSAAISNVNRLRRIATLPRSGWLLGFGLALVATLAWMVVADAATARVVAQALSHPAVVVAVAGLYGAWLVPLRWRAAAVGHAGSWLVATPHVPSTRDAILAAVLRDLVVRWLTAAFVAVLASINTAVTLRESLMLLALLTGGLSIGAIFGGWRGWRGAKPRHEQSRYLRRPRAEASVRPSAQGLSRWPIAQALAWARPENARLLVAVAILAVPGGVGPAAAMGLLASWAVGSYLVALLLALPRVARAASDWLRSSPITFWAFAWALSRRMLLHQVGSTIVGVTVMVVLGADAWSTLYAGTLWLVLVALVTVLSLADCYHARSSGPKVVLSVLTVLVAEQRWRGWGIAFALMLTAMHMRRGKRYARP